MCDNTSPSSREQTVPEGTSCLSPHPEGLWEGRGDQGRGRAPGAGSTRLALSFGCPSAARLPLCRGRNRDLRAQKHRPQQSSCSRGGSRMLLQTQDKDGESARHQNSPASEGRAGARGGGRGRDRDGGTRGEERGAPRPLAFRTREQVRGPGAPAPADTRPPRGRRGAQGLPHARTLLFPRKKTVAVRVGFLVTLLSSFPEPIHACGDVTACHPPGARTAAKRVQCGPLAGAQMTPPGGVGRGSGRAGPENDRTQCSGSELGARGGRMSGG